MSQESANLGNKVNGTNFKTKPSGQNLAEHNLAEFHPEKSAQVRVHSAKVQGTSLPKTLCCSEQKVFSEKPSSSVSL